MGRTGRSPIEVVEHRRAPQAGHDRAAVRGWNQPLVEGAARHGTPEYYHEEPAVPRTVRCQELSDTARRLQGILSAAREFARAPSYFDGNGGLARPYGNGECRQPAVGSRSRPHAGNVGALLARRHARKGHRSTAGRRPRARVDRGTLRTCPFTAL